MGNRYLRRRGRVCVRTPFERVPVLSPVVVGDAVRHARLRSVTLGLQLVALETGNTRRQFVPDSELFRHMVRGIAILTRWRNQD